MRTSLTIVLAAISIVQAAYSGDIVQYWVDQTAILVNGTIIGGLQSPPSAWIQAVVQGAVYLAATNSQNKSRAFQQLAVSHAAHNSLQWAFHGTRNFLPTDQSLKAILDPIGIVANTSEGLQAKNVGKNVARTVALARTDDGSNDYVDYEFGPRLPGAYQQTPGGAVVPDTPQARYVRLWANLGDVTQYQAAPPPSVYGPDYEAALLRVKTQGEQNSTVRTPYDTDTAYFWRESSPAVWNRIANAVIGNSLATDVLKSAKLYAQLNYALANAGVAAWYTKYKYNTWRPITAIRYPGIWLQSGANVTQPDWTPLLTPTPSHQDYVSTHATFGGAAAQIIRTYNGGDSINATWSSNVTLNGRGVITRTFSNLTEAEVQNGESRVFGGIHFPFAAPAAIRLGTDVAVATLERFDESWDAF